jgi:catechol 2,3-dioxygenase-like lactoylglutathione lyase family enzyme
MNKLLKIDNVMYRVSNLKKSEDFYTKILGLKKAWEDSVAKMIGFTFEHSDSEIVIHMNPNIPKGDFSYLVNDVVAFCNEVKNQGYNVLLEPIDVRPGKYAVLVDPDGNEIPIIDLTGFGGKPKND